MTTYENIALQWQPDSENNTRFMLFAIFVVLIFLVTAIAMSLVDVPEEERAKVVVPDRVAQFIKNKPKPKPKPVEPKPELKKPPKPKPTVERQKEEKAPLTEVEKAARDKAEKAGILAFAEELSDLMDSSVVDAAVATEVKAGSGGREDRATVDTDSIIASAGRGSGGVDGGKYAGSVGTTQLTQAEIAAVQQSLFKEDRPAASEREDSARARGDNVRTEEEVIVVIDRNKGQLQALYDRERRKKPGLKGRIVFEVTISPAGAVTKVRILSSELNEKSLEQRLVARIKALVFEAKAVESVTVTFPIEFLPS